MVLGLLTKAAVTGVVAYTVVKVLEKTGAAEKVVTFANDALTKFKEGFEQEQQFQQAYARAKEKAEEFLKGNGNV